jgi:hypothetical protein
MITNNQFRVDYPEFAGTTVYTNSQLTYYFNLAYQLLNASRWGQTLDVGAELFVAHHITMEARSMAESANGGMPGQDPGLVASKSVDKVSVSFDTGAIAEKDGGHWNQTLYGRRFLRLVRMFGAGPIQLGMGYQPPNTGLAWSGPAVYPGFTTLG